MLVMTRRADGGVDGKSAALLGKELTAIHRVTGATMMKPRTLRGFFLAAPLAR
jgi:hypothetical protein